ncbi:hypothetical protein EYF80_001994 [Liparis tanakae]|uniref:Uncharacterized protein n=1 Tax=Liparis tanakae TaxID=230148 RepID=A0A4Z2JCC6_9TELE|nr:hypothetical protein EYF80_001994 [Liparis tanakae]
MNTKQKLSPTVLGEKEGLSSVKQNIDRTDTTGHWRRKITRCLSKPILTQLPCMAVFGPGPWHTNQPNAARTTGSQSRGETNNRRPRMGLSHWAGRVATVPALKLVHKA